MNEIIFCSDLLQERLVKDITRVQSIFSNSAKWRVGIIFLVMTPFPRRHIQTTYNLMWSEIMFQIFLFSSQSIKIAVQVWTLFVLIGLQEQSHYSREILVPFFHRCQL